VPRERVCGSKETMQSRPLFAELNDPNGSKDSQSHRFCTIDYYLRFWAHVKAFPQANFRAHAYVWKTCTV